MRYVLWLPLFLAACEQGNYTPAPGSEEEQHPDVQEPQTAPAAQLPPEPDAAPAIVVVEPPPGAGVLKVALNPPSADLVLGETKTFSVSLTSEGGYTGEVQLQAQGLPPSWVATFTPPTATVAANGSTSVQLRIDIPTLADARMAPLVIAAAGPGGSGAVMPLAVNVAPEVIIHIPPGALNMGVNAFGTAPTQVRYLAPGTKVTWKNDDSIQHRIHGPGTNGFTHQLDNDMLKPGGSYSVTITAAANFDYFCHTHPSMKGRLEVMLPPPPQ